MNIGLAAATFAVVIPAELPDKTFISTVVLSSRYRAIPVWIGAAAGLIIQAAIAVTLGRVLALAPHRVVEGVVAILFLGGAGYLLFFSERQTEEVGAEIALEHEASIEATTRRTTPGIPVATALRVAATTFGVIALAEFGDLTQIVIANFTARSRDPVSVFIGAAPAFVVISGIGVLAGHSLARFVSFDLLRKFSGLVLLGLGIWSVVSVAGG